MYLIIAALLPLLFAQDLTVTVTCGTDNCAGGYTVNGLTNPSIHCNVGDTITFDVQAPGQPLYIKTAQTVGSGNLWSNTGNNGQESGTVTLSCTSAAQVSTPLYYQSGSSYPPSGVICIGDACGAPLCTAAVCWGESSPASTSPDDLEAYITSLAPDFAYFIRKTASVSAFAWEGSWSKINGLWAVKVSYVRLDLSDTVTQQIISVLAENTGVPTSTYGIVVTYDGQLSGESSAYIFIGDPSQAEDELGGYVDVLFFAGINEDPQCNIHDQCGKYSCYAFRNLIGEYSGDNHVREGQCLRNFESNWGYVQVRIDTARDGGTYRMGCDSLCIFCQYEGQFSGDQCVCAVGSMTDYNCISVKFAASSLLVPSMVVALFLSVMSLF